MNIKIGFIGQGWIGKNYADDFEGRGYDVVRYALEEPYVQNKDKIKDCEIVFVAVPTPTTPEGFDDSHVRSALDCLTARQTAVIKSTITPGTTERLHKEFPDLFVLHSPEFLVEKTAAYDAAHPNRNIVGMPLDTDEYKQRAENVLSILPEAPYAKIMSARDAELLKYAGNCFLYTKVVYMNLLHDLVEQQGADWETLREALIHDPRVGESHTNPVHQGGRGAGGHCFIKDFEAFRLMYEDAVKDPRGSAVLQALIEKNNKLLFDSNKNLDLLEGVYGNLEKYKD